MRWSAWPTTPGTWGWSTELAGNGRYTALLDACVLYPLATVDALMSLAAAGLYSARWTVHIEQEWMRSLEAKRPDLAGKLDYRRDCMREAVPDWEVSWNAVEPLIGSLQLPDPNDAHVLAAAIAGHADCIVTANLRDFPHAIIEPYGIEIIDPDRFIVAQWDLAPYAAVAAFKQVRARLRRPEMTPEAFAAAFERGGLPATAERIREALPLI